MSIFTSAWNQSLLPRAAPALPGACESKTKGEGQLQRPHRGRECSLALGFPSLKISEPAGGGLWHGLMEAQRGNWAALGSDPSSAPSSLGVGASRTLLPASAAAGVSVPKGIEPRAV